MPSMTRIGESLLGGWLPGPQAHDEVRHVLDLGVRYLAAERRHAVATVRDLCLDLRRVVVEPVGNRALAQVRADGWATAAEVMAAGTPGAFDDRGGRQLVERRIPGQRCSCGTGRRAACEGQSDQHGRRCQAECDARRAAGETPVA